MVAVDAQDSANRVDLLNFCFAADFRTDLGLESDSGGTTCFRETGLDLGEGIRFVKGDSEPEPRSSSEGANRVDDLFPFGFVVASGLESEDKEEDLAFIIPLLIGVSSVLSRVEPLARTSLHFS